MLSGRTRAGRGTQWCVRVYASSCGPGYGPPASIWHLIDTLQLAVDLLVAANISWALKLVEDGLLPLPSTQDDNALSPCNQLRKAPLAADIPIMVIDQNADLKGELEFLQRGAAG